MWNFLLKLNVLACIRWLCVIFKHWQLSQLISLTPVMTNTFCTIKQSPVTAKIQFKPKTNPIFSSKRFLLIPSTHRCSFFKNPVALHSLWFTQTTHSVPPSVCPAIESIFSMSIWWLKWKVGSRQISARRTPTNHIFHFKSRIFKRQWKSVFVHRNNRLITLTSARHAFFCFPKAKLVNQSCVTPGDSVFVPEKRSELFECLLECAEGDLKLLLIDQCLID